jgi:hypothetical protein
MRWDVEAEDTIGIFSMYRELGCTETTCHGFYIGFHLYSKKYKKAVLLSSFWNESRVQTSSFLYFCDENDKNSLITFFLS